MRAAAALVAALVAAAPALAQQVNATYFAGLVSTLRSLNATRLASAVDGINTTTSGQTILANLNDTSKPFTLFAPNDHSWVGVPSNITSDKNLLAAILAFHLSPGQTPNTTFATAPSHTVLRTLLNDTTYVNLGSGARQVLVVTKSNKTGRAEIYGQNTRVRIVNGTTYQNILIHVVNAVIDLPPTMHELLSRNFTSLSSGLTAANLLNPVENAKGITVFAPTNQALVEAQQAIGQVNQTVITNVLANHVINGTAVYSPELGSGTHVSAAGQQFSFSTNSSGTFVTSGNSTARIVTSDLITNNGVVHAIDGVLLNPNADQGAASTAYSSATSSVGQAASTQVGPIGSSVSSPSPTGSGGSTNTSGASTRREVNLRGYIFSAAAAVLGGLVGGAFVL